MKLLDLPPEVLAIIFDFWSPTLRKDQHFLEHGSDLGKVLLTSRTFYHHLHRRFTNAGIQFRDLPEAEKIAALIIRHEITIHNRTHIDFDFRFDRFAAFLNITALWFNFVVDASSPLSQLARDAIKLLRLEELVVNQLDYLTPVGGPTAYLPFLRTLRVIAFPQPEDVSSSDVEVGQVSVLVILAIDSHPFCRRMFASPNSSPHHFHKIGSHL